MPVFLGPFDPLQLVLKLINVLMQRGYLTVDEARRILHDSMQPNMSEEEKNRILDSMIRRG